ncbi:uncharacterized protein LOC143021015 [Oratosquilla oratoria]|uniref:uncharacterized protein LOC143021015 n=1 Tax=Oratosquilla oratoria TaxID=337810 RepID=UPI003F76A3E8
MFLNVTLTPPPPSSGGEGSCTTPKTPEILNSLINLTSPPLPQSYPLYQSQQAQLGQGDLLSPVSDATTPGEEVAAAPLDGSTTPAGTPVDARQRGGLMGVDLGWGRCLVGGDRGVEGGGGGDGGGGGGMCRGGLVGGSPGTSGLRGPLMGSSPPATPDLPSPVTTVQATKTALIKEGLKHQIRTKLQAAGVGPEFILTDSKLVKEENSDDDALTHEDEERRRRRRERNKIAATKCRNKKKEKTQILMSESESVEDQNTRLKSELQRLTHEKSNLEKLLRDPNHRASCRHAHARKAAPHSRPTPQVVVTPADNSPTTETPTSSALRQQPPSSSSPPSTYHFTSLPNLGSPPLGSPPLSSPTSSTCSSSSSSSSCSSSPTTPPSSQVTPPTSSAQFLAHKYTHNLSRHHPYQHPHHRPVPPPLHPLPHPQAPSIPASHAQPTLPQSSAAYVDHSSRTATSSSPSSSSSPTATSASSPTTPDFPQSSATPRTHYSSNSSSSSYHNPSSMTKPQEFLQPPAPSKSSSTFSPGPSKIRNNSLARFVPYSRSGRPPTVPSPLSTHAHPQPMLSVGAPAPTEGLQSFSQGGGGGNPIVCRREDQYLTDPRQNQFFPPCTLGGM